MSRVPQLWDDNVVEFRFPSDIEEWAEDAIKAGFNYDWDVSREPNGPLIARTMTGGNLNGIEALRGFCDDLEEAFNDAGIDPMTFQVLVTSLPREEDE